jgi:hypothetical protein
MRRESTGAHFTLKLANAGMTSVGGAWFKSPLAHTHVMSQDIGEEFVAEGLQLGDRAGLLRLGAEPFLQRLLEAFDAPLFVKPLWERLVAMG